MSIKRSSSGRQPTRGLGGDTGKSSTKIDKQDLFEELHRRAESDQPFTATDLAAALGVTETVAGRHLLLLSTDGFVDRLEGGKYSAAPMRETGLAQFLKELAAAAKNPQREKDLQDIARLKSNNDIMRDRLLQAHAERDRYLALLRKHGIDPNEDPGIGQTAAPAPPPAPIAAESPVPRQVTAEVPTAPITTGSGAPAPVAAPPVAASPPAVAPAASSPAPAAEPDDDLPPPLPPPPSDPRIA
jgi:DNA-binding transcriptional ArsR family regulator